MSWISRNRENINVKLFNLRAPVMRVLNILGWLASLAGLGIIVWHFGFSPPAAEVSHLIIYLQRILDFLVLKYLLKLLFDFKPWVYLRNNISEAVVAGLILSETFVQLIFGVSWWYALTGLLGFSDEGYFLVVQLFFWIVVTGQVGRASMNTGKIKINPAALLALSFLLLIVAGTLLLKLPEMTVGRHISWSDALFTSTSASCVTGLIVQDTATFFTLKGKLVIMLLFQLGGLNMLSIATFIGTFYKRSGSLQSMTLLRDFLDTDQTGNLRSILRKVIYYSFLVELVGALMLFFLWGNNYQFTSHTDRAFFSVFHSISAFNNAGFSLFTHNLFETGIRFQYGAHVVIMMLVITGGLGFIVLQDLFSAESRRARRRYKWRKLMVNTRLVLSVSLFLLLSGAVLFFVFEYNHSLSDHSLGGKIVASLFQSATTRTAGFNTVNMSALTMPVLLFFMLFMFIGASPGSTGGGIKTTTVAVALKAALANLRGRQHVEIYRRNIPWNLVNKTYAVIAMALTFLFVCTLLLAYTHPQFSFSEILFEQVSAMGTVGLSLGITAQLSTVGKIILVVSMFVGRIGTLTMGVILSRKVVSKNYRYADTRLMIG